MTKIVFFVQLKILLHSKVMTALASGAELPENVIIDKVEQLHIDIHHDNHLLVGQICENQENQLTAL